MEIESGNYSDIVANEALSIGDLAEIDALTQKASRVRISDYASVGTMTTGTAQTNAATGQIVAQTSIGASGGSIAGARQQVLQGTDGGIYVLVIGSQLSVNKYSPNGTLLGSSASFGASNLYDCGHMFFLSNGNILLAATNNVTNLITWAIIDTSLATIKSAQTTAAVASVYFSACALSGGGFAIIYHDSGSNLTSKLVTFDNAGTSVLAATTVWTRTGTSGTQYQKIRQLSNGNLVIAVVSNNTVSSIGLYHGIVDTSGGSVLAFTSINTTATNAQVPEVDVLTGYYCIARANDRAAVYNNAGTIQGSALVTAGANTVCTNKLINDGTYFWLIWSGEKASKIPTTGANNATTTTVTTATTQSGFAVDAFYENGLIVCISGTTTATAPTIWVIDCSTGLLANTKTGGQGTTIGTAAGTSGTKYPRIIPGGDASFIALYDYTTTYAVNLCVGKYAQTAIIGEVSVSAAAGGTATIDSSSGFKSVTAINGSSPIAFDMQSSGTLYGNKGTLMANNAVLKGL